MRTTLLALVSISALTACGGGGVVNQDDHNTDDNTTGTPNLVIDKSSIDFGTVPLNATETEVLTLSNSGTAELTITSIEFTGTGFTATAGAGLAIAAGSSNSIGVQYLPTDYIDDSGTLTIGSDDPDEPSIVINLVGQVLTDADGDGYDSEAAGGTDCDDEDPNAYPGADDEWYDGHDSNCDGADDFDQDADGYQSDIYNDDPENGGGDCQDNDPNMHPGAVDVWYDGPDSDCDGSDDFDQDNDGFGSHGHGDDCDDTNPDINPDALEVFNGVDDDCDGDTDWGVIGGDADLMYTGTTSGDAAGFAITTGDLNDDGSPEIIVGSYNYSSGRGLVSVFDSTSMPSTGSDMADGTNYFAGDSSSDQLGMDVAYLSAFGTNGAAYLAVGAPGAHGNYGQIFVIPGDDAVHGGDTDDATLIIEGDGYYYVGTGIGQDLDINADGLEDLYGYWYDNNDEHPGVFLQYGDSTGSYTIGTVDGAWSTDGDNTIMKNSFPTGGDLNGDGYDDAIWCDHLVDVASSTEDYDDGAVYAFFGKAIPYSGSGIQDIESTAHVVAQGDESDRIGLICAIVDDMNGDGADELFVYDRRNNQLFGIWGDPSLATNTMLPSEEAFVSYNFASSDPQPETIRSIGDWTGDGVAEIAVGIEASSSKAGQVWVLSSEVDSGSWDADRECFATAQGDNDDPYYQSYYGSAISDLPADVNGDGKMDFIVGDYGYSGASGSSNNTGAIYISYNLTD